MTTRVKNILLRILIGFLLGLILCFGLYMLIVLDSYVGVIIFIVCFLLFLIGLDKTKQQKINKVSH